MDTEVTTREASAGPPPVKLPGVGVLFRSAWERFTHRWKTLISLACVPLALMLALLLLVFTLDAGEGSMFAGSPVGSGLLLLVGSFAVMLVSIATHAGQTYVAASASPASFSFAFSWGWRRFLSLAGLWLIFLVLLLPLVLFLLGTFVVGLVFGLPLFSSGDSGGALRLASGLGLGALLLTILYGYLTVRLSFAQPLVALAEASIIGALKESWRLTAGRFWSLFWRYAALVGLLSLVIFAGALVVGLLSSVGGRGSTWSAGLFTLLRFVLQAVVGVYALVYTIVLFRGVQSVAERKPTVSENPSATVEESSL